MDRRGAASEFLVLFLIVLIATIGVSTFLFEKEQAPNGQFHKRIRVRLPVCGNGIIEKPEQCEPPNTATCDALCKKIAFPVPIAECLDSDGGWNLKVAGAASISGRVVCKDRCANEQELQVSGGRDQLFECFCGNRQGSGGGQGSAWVSCPAGTVCKGSECVRVEKPALPS